jgi:N-glycosylase/DNA lyase
MRNRQPHYCHVDELHALFEQRKNAIRSRLDEFARIKPEEYSYELAYCLLTPQSSAVNAAKAVEALKAVRFFTEDVDTSAVLADRRHYIRFHNTKARHLHEAKEHFAEIMTQLSRGSSSPEIRAWLVHNVRGLGWKEASHFLRNIGHRNLAILDRHILKNLKRHNVLRSIPKTLTPSRYCTIEKRFAAFAQTAGITMDELDLLFWSRETGEILK